jgi:small-conductance mechanosensitive channel
MDEIHILLISLISSGVVFFVYYYTRKYLLKVARTYHFGVFYLFIRLFGISFGILLAILAFIISIDYIFKISIFDAFTEKIIYTTLILLIFGELITNILTAFFSIITFHKEDYEKDLKSTISIKRIIGVIVFIFIFLIALSTFGVDVYPLVAGLGIGGVLFAFAIRDLVANYISSLIILSENTYRVGDFIEIIDPRNPIKGKIIDISWRCTTLLDRNHNLITVPNYKLANAITKNFHLPQDSIILKIKLKVFWNGNIDKLEHLIKESCKEVSTKFKSEFDPKIYFESLKGNILEIKIYIKSNKLSQFEELTHELIKTICKKFEENNMCPKNIIYFITD